MAGADALLVGLLRLAGKTPADLEAYAGAFENRLRDVKALTRGGTMSDGVNVPGLGALYTEVRALMAEVRALRESLPKPVIDVAATSATSSAESTAESSGGNPQPQQE